MKIFDEIQIPDKYFPAFMLSLMLSGGMLLAGISIYLFE